MDKEILFQITEENLETGLRGYPVGYCPTSYVDEKKGLFYVGYPIVDLCSWDPVEVIYLLMTGQRGSKADLQKFQEEIHKRSSLSKEVVQRIYALPQKGLPMDHFSAAIQILGMVEQTKDYQESCMNLIAKLPLLAATVINAYQKWGETPSPRIDLGYMGNFTHMLNLPSPEDKKLLGEVFRLFNIIHYDHGGGNLSTFVGKAVASGLQHMYGSISASMNALAGPLHGRANEDALYFVEAIYKQVKDNCTEENVEAILQEKVSKQELIFGFGHAVLRAEDPRAKILYEFAEKHYSSHPLVKTALLLRKVGPKVLKQQPKISDPYPNIDAISGIVLAAAGFPHPKLFTILFGLARAVGISIQIVYERIEAREGKGTPIVRPKYFYRPRKKH